MVFAFHTSKTKHAGATESRDTLTVPYGGQRGTGERQVTQAGVEQGCLSFKQMQRACSCSESVQSLPFNTLHPHCCWDEDELRSTSYSESHFDSP